MGDGGCAPDQIECRRGNIGRRRHERRGRLGGRIDLADSPAAEQAVAAPDRVVEHVAVGAKGLADRRDMDAQRAFLDVDPAPDLLGQVGPRHEFAVRLHQLRNDIKGAAPERDGHAHRAQFAPGKIDFPSRGSVDGSLA